MTPQHPSHHQASRAGRFRRSVSLLALATAVLPTLALAQTPAEDETIPTATRLGTVVVTATATEHTTLTSPSFTTVITREEIEEAAGVNDLPDILRRYVGVENRLDDNGRNELVMRGMAGSYTLVLVNGRRVSSGNALWRGGDFDYNSIPLSAIERVEIVRGPMSALYGADAIGGVINIITREAEDRWTGSVSTEYRFVDSGNKGDQYRLNMFATGPLMEGLSASVAAEMTRRDAWFTPNKDNGRTPALEEKNLQNLALGVTWDGLENQQVDLRYGYNRDDRPYNLYILPNRYRDQTITRHTFSASHEGRWAWGSSLLEANYEHGRIDDFNTTYTAPQQRTLHENTLFLHGRVTVPFQGHLLTGGAEYRNQVVRDPVSFAGSGQSEMSQTALYLQDEIPLTDSLSVTLGGRYDNHEVFGDHMTGRANAVYRLTDYLTFRGGIGQGFKAPGPHHLNRNYSIVSCGGACTITGDPTIKPEHSTNVEVGFEIQQPTWDLSVAAYRNSVKDMITTRTLPGPQRVWINETSVVIKGVEISGSVDLLDTLTLSGNHTYMSTRSSTGQPLDNRPRHRTSATLAWTVVPDVTTSASAHYTGTQRQGTTRLPAYTTFDLGVTATLFETVQGNVGVRNLTNVSLREKNPAFLGEELGRNFYLGLTYSF